MKLFDSLRQRVTNLLTAPLAELGSWARLARGQVNLWRYCIRRLHQNNVMAMSAALSFRTIFALVPMIIVAFLAMKSLGVVEDSKQILRDFLDRSGLSQITYVEAAAPGATPPETPDTVGNDRRITVSEKVEALVEGVEKQLTVGRVGPISVALLIWTALTLLTTVERSLNRIFEAPRSRSLARRILIYWSAVTLGPLILVTVSRVGGDLIEAVRNLPVLEWTLGPLGWVAPILVGVLLLAGLYAVMPNTPVRFRLALKGAVLAVPLWAVAKWGFSLYVEHVGRHSLYGALGLIPLFLMWLNFSWWIFLFGAEVSHAAGNVTRMLRANVDGDHPPTPWHYLAAVLAVARAQADGESPVASKDVAGALGLPPQAAEAILGGLCESAVLVRVAGDGPLRCVLALPAGRIHVSQVLAASSPDGDDPGRAAEESDIARAVADVRRRTGAGVADLTVADLLPQ
ncbi:MAG: YihY/virulence factor BrkB family protein [Planctomycetes bacterium]|nr:YihY/virulence factor BrkB family protein [Planctomycetota bacterium]